MSYKIVFFDIDGTLINEDRKIPLDTKEAIKKLKDSHVEVVIATGRAPYHLKPIADELEIDSYIAFNGAFAVHRGEQILREAIPASSIRQLDEYARKNNHPLVYLGGEDYFASHQDHPDIEETFQWLKIAPPTYHQEFWKENPIYQVMLYCTSHEEAPYPKQFPDLKFVRWHNLSMDVLASGGSKAKGIEFMLGSLGFLPAEAAAFGDALNDREMLSYVGMGIAMGNAHEELKPYAKFTTKHVDEGGIRYGLEQIGLL